MEIVINTCYGGFGLSHEAVMLYADKKGIDIHAFMATENHEIFTPYMASENPSCIYYSTKPLLKSGEMAKGTYWDEYDLDRDDECLVAVVKKLGKKADGAFAQLKIVEIPDDISWGINEREGIEHIEETHRTWN